MKLGSEVITDGSKTVKLDVDTNDNAKFTLINIVEDDEIEEITVDDVTMTAGESSYTFTKNATLEEGTISISGTLYPGIMTKDAGPVYATLDFQCTFTPVDPENPTPTTLEGTWKLGIDSDGQVDFGIISNTGNLMVDGLVSTLAVPAIQEMIGTKVENVTINFGENNIFNFTWRPVGGEDVNVADLIIEKFMPDQPDAVKEMVRQAMTFFYSLDEDNEIVYVGLSKAAFETISGMPINDQIKGILAVITPLLTETEQGYLIPVRYSLSGGNAKFYMDKAMIAGYLPVVMEIITGLGVDLSDLGFDLQMIAQAILGAEQFDISLGFVK